MALTVNEGAGNYIPCPPGTYAARLAQLIDLGHQQTAWEGKAKSVAKILLTFEITDAETRRDDGAAYTISRRYTASLNKKAALRGLLEAWRGKQFTDDELKSFDLKTLLGKACMVNIVHAAKNDRVYANLSSIMRLPKGFPPGIDTEQVAHFDLSEPDWQVFAALPSRVQGQIAASPEFLALPNKPKTVSLTPGASAPTRAPTPASTPRPSAPAAPKPLPSAAWGSGFDDMDDDIPF